MKKNIRFSHKDRAIIGLIFACAIVIGLLFVAKRNADTEAPEISYSNTKMKLGVHKAAQLDEGDYHCLLKDVTAIDNVDGDVSDRIIVKSCRVSDDKKYAVVTYQVADRSANYAYTRRIVYFRKEVYAPQDVHPVLKLTTDKIEVAVGQEPNFKKYIEELSDDVDDYDTLLNNIVVKGSLDISVPGKYKLTMYTVDKDGNKSEKVHPTIVVLPDPDTEEVQNQVEETAQSQTYEATQRPTYEATQKPTYEATQTPTHEATQTPTHEDKKEPVKEDKNKTR